MSRQPDHATSNYGWALWHLEQATGATNYVAAQVHATAANARAALAAIDLREGRFEGSTWTRPPAIRCMCDPSQIDPHTIDEHHPSPTTPTHQPTEETKA